MPEPLKNDESEYVRRSVANNLNDIAKDNPDVIIRVAKRWIGKNPETGRLVKHARKLFKISGSDFPGREKGSKKESFFQKHNYKEILPGSSWNRRVRKWQRTGP